MSGDAVGAVVGGLSGVVGAAVTGWLLVRREREVQRPVAERTAVDGFDTLVGRLEHDIARLTAELAAARADLARVVAEVEACEQARRATEARVAALEGQLARAGLLDRRSRDDGPPGPERRQQ